MIENVHNVDNNIAKPSKINNIISRAFQKIENQNLVGIRDYTILTLKLLFKHFTWNISSVLNNLKKMGRILNKIISLESLKCVHFQLKVKMVPLQFRRL